MAFAFAEQAVLRPNPPRAQPLQTGDGPQQRVADTVPGKIRGYVHDVANADEVPAMFERVVADNATYTNADYWAALASWRLEDHDAAENFAARYASTSALA